MAKTLSISDAREQLMRLPDELAASRDIVQITRHGDPVLAVLRWELYEAILETLDVMSEPDTLAALRASVEDLAAGRTISLDALEAELTTPARGR